MGVAATVAAAIILFGLNLQVGHYAQGGENIQNIEKNTRSIGETEEIQERLVGIVESLSSIHKGANAALAKVAELCRAGKLKDCSDCAAAGVTLQVCIAD